MSLRGSCFAGLTHRKAHGRRKAAIIHAQEIAGEYCVRHLGRSEPPGNSPFLFLKGALKGGMSAFHYGLASGVIRDARGVGNRHFREKRKEATGAIGWAVIGLDS